MSILCECFSEQDILEAAAHIMERRLSQVSVFTSIDAVKEFLLFKLGAEEREHFLVMFLSPQHNLISAEIMFSGTLTQTSVYPREVVRRALMLNASSVILSHNHPSGTTDPSRADELLTQTLKSALHMIDVRVVDHIIVADKTTLSFAERGLI
jgi:DNA repair protein RadC